VVKDDTPIVKVVLLLSAAEEKPDAISNKPRSAPADEPDIIPTLPPVPDDVLPDVRQNAPPLLALSVEPTVTVIDPASPETASPVAKVKKPVLAPFVATSISPESPTKS
jgi:hypothetical protein